MVVVVVKTRCQGPVGLLSQIGRGPRRRKHLRRKRKCFQRHPFRDHKLHLDGWAAGSDLLVVEASLRRKTSFPVQSRTSNGGRASSHRTPWYATLCPAAIPKGFLHPPAGANGEANSSEQRRELGRHLRQHTLRYKVLCVCR